MGAHEPLSMNRVAVVAFCAPLTLAVALIALHRHPTSQDGASVAAPVSIVPPSSVAVPAGVPQTVATEDSITGQASVVDGDTLEIHGVRIRLNGIDAPEASQRCDANGTSYRCGQKAAFALDEILADKTVVCVKLDTDRYGRTIAKCTVAQIDVSAEMVRRGWAIAYRKYSLEYVPLEDAARTKGVGLWAGSFENPAEYRRTGKKN